MPALDPVLMLDGRQPTLDAQALGAIRDHAQPTILPDADDLAAIRQFQLTDAFFSSPARRAFAQGGPAPELPLGNTDAEKRGRRFFLDLPPDATFKDGLKDGLCAGCHSGPLLNQTNRFLPVPGVPPGSRFQTVAVSELNAAGNPCESSSVRIRMAPRRACPARIPGERSSPVWGRGPADSTW